MNAGDEAMTVNDVDAAVARYDAAATMVPESAEMVYWAGITLASVGRLLSKSLDSVLRYRVHPFLCSGGSHATRDAQDR